METEAAALARYSFSNNHPMYAMLFHLQALNMLRIIEALD